MLKGKKEKKTENKSNLKSKKSKKKIIIAVIVAVLIIICIVAKTLSSKGDNQKELTIKEIEKREIATSISATGTITTSSTKNVTSKLSGYEITSVNVVEGQKINVGDVICTFDTTALQRSLNDAKASLNATQTQNYYSILNAERSLNDAKNNKNTTTQDTQSQIDSALNTLNSLNSQLTSATNQLTAAKASESSAKAAVDAKAGVIAENDRLKKELDQATQNKTNTEATLKNAQTDVENLKAMDASLVDVANSLTLAQAALQTAQTNYSTASAAYNTAKSSYDAYQATYNSVAGLKAAYEAATSNSAALSTQVTALTSQRDAAQSAYDSLVKAQNTQTTAADSTIAGLDGTLASSKAGISASTITQQSQINTLNDQIADGKIVSTVSGTVTKVNVKKGDIYTGTTIATIEGCEDFIVESQIGEYDIADVKEGMKVFVKTDATRDEELEGRITYVAPSATTNEMTSMTSATSGGTSSAKYKVNIELNNQNDRLRIGMNAKISIVTNNKENAICVPFDAVQKRDDDSKYIELLVNEDTKETKEVNVTTGIEGTYYVEVSSNDTELKEGMKIVMPEIDANASINALIDAMGANAGM